MPIGGNASDLALAAAQYIQQSVGGLWVPLTDATILGASSAASIPAVTVVSLTTVAAQLATHSAALVILQNDPANTQNILLGNAATQAYVLEPGAAVTWPISNSNLVYAKAASGTPNLNLVVLL